MRPTEIITLEIFQNNQWVSYTDGLITASIIRGVEEYTGPLIQPEVGQLTITSRNEDLDPYNNNNIRYNAKIRLNAGSTRIFTGRIEGIDVQYRPKNEPPIITISAFDLIGTMYKHKLSDDFISTQQFWSTTDLLSELSLNNEVAEWQNYVVDTDGLSYSEGPISLGTTVYEALNTRVKTDLGFYFANARNEIEYYRRDRDDVLHPFNSRPAAITFDYDGNGTSYTAISLNDGFEKIVNEVIIAGVGNYDSTQIAVTAGDSVALWGKTAANARLATDDIASLQAIGNEILVEMGEPIREIYKISWDSTLNPDVAKTIDIMDNIHINHRINANTSIDRKYGVVGIKHEINADSWLTTYAVRNYDYQSTSIPNPVIVINPPSGGSEVDFNFSYTHPNPELITGQYWNLDESNTSTSESVTVNYLLAGTKTITLTVDTIYGYSKTTTVQLDVGLALPVSSFTYTIDDTNIVYFTFTGSGLGSINWDFGDGTASSDTNPSKFYLSSGARNVTCTVSNTEGLAVSSQVIQVTSVSKIPVKFVRLRMRQSTLLRNYPNFSDIKPGLIHSLKFYDTANAELAAGYTLVDYKDVGGFLTSTPNDLDEYGRTLRTNTSLIELQNRIKGTSGVFVGDWEKGYQDTYNAPDFNGNTQEVNYRARHQIVALTFDLGENYFSFKEPRISRKRFDNSTVTEERSPTIEVDVSYDGTNWRYIGYMMYPTVGTQGTEPGPLISTFYPHQGVVAPFTFSNTIEPFEYDWKPVRYIKLDFNAPTATTPNYWSLLSVTPFCGTGSGTSNAQDILGKTNADHFFGRGGINLNARTGANLTLDATNSSGVNGVVKTYTGASTGTIAQSVINPGQSGITNWNNIDLTGTNNISSSIFWQETTGQKTFTYDFGQPIYSFCGLDIQTGVLNTSGTSSNVMDGGYLVTVSTSLDNITFTTIGTFSMNYTNTGGKIINGNTKIRVVPDKSGNFAFNSDAPGLSMPVHAGTTWQQIATTGGTIP